MRLLDDLRFSTRALTAHPLRTWLTLVAMAFGTAAVVLLSALGEGARQYVAGEFAQLGTHLLVVIPGRNETTGGPPPVLGETPRDLTLDDAIALGRARAVEHYAPIVLGSAYLSVGSLEREAIVLGSTSAYRPIRHLEMSVGRFLPPGDPERGRPVIVLGQKLVHELFGQKNPLGARVRLGDRRFRVIGVLATSGESLGVDLGEMAIIPVASAQALFDSPALFRIIVQASSRADLEDAESEIRQIIMERHEGEDDITIITQDAMLSTFDTILTVLTLAVAGIAAISLIVAGVLIMNVMLISVAQRTAEVGLLNALGAARGQIAWLFLSEAWLLSAAGTAGGLIVAYGAIEIANGQLGGFELIAPLWAPVAAALVAMGTALIFGLLPALRAARLDPVLALSGR